MARLRPRCKATGCRARALAGSEYCRVHSPSPSATEALPATLAVRPEGRTASAGRAGRPAVRTGVPGDGTNGERGATAAYGEAQRERVEALRAGPGFYDDVLAGPEWTQLRRRLEAPIAPAETSDASSMLEEVALMRALIWRVMQRFEDDPARALPLVRQGVDAICRALRTQRVLSGEGADSLSQAFAVALREIGEELGIDHANG